MRTSADVQAFRSENSRENAGAPVTRWVRTTLPWMSMTVTADGHVLLEGLGLGAVSDFLPDGEYGRGLVLPFRK